MAILYQDPKMVIIPAGKISRIRRKPESPLQPCELWRLPSTELRGPILVLAGIRNSIENCET